MLLFFFFFKQKTAYEVRISDWSSDVCSSDLEGLQIQTAILDVRKQADVDAAAQAMGSVDVLFNCAGFVASGTILECSESDWDFSMDLNVKAIGRASCRERGCQYV